MDAAAAAKTSAATHSAAPPATSGGEGGGGGDWKLPLPAAAQAAANAGMLAADTVALEKEKLGTGGQAQVFSGYVLREGDWVPTAHKFCASTKFSRADVLHEATVHARLKGQPSCALSELGMRGIVDVYGVYDPPEGGAVVMVFEKCTGGGLDKLLEYSPTVALSPDRRRRLVLQLAATIAHVHAHNVVHADLKTENIMLAADGSLRLIDVRERGLAAPCLSVLLTFHPTPPRHTPRSLGCTSARQAAPRRLKVVAAKAAAGRARVRAAPPRASGARPSSWRPKCMPRAGWAAPPLRAPAPRMCTRWALSSGASTAVSTPLMTSRRSISRARLQMASARAISMTS